MNEDLQKEPEQEAPQPDEQPVEERSVDELEQKLIDALKTLNRKNKMVEEYLDNLAQTNQKPAPSPESNGSSPVPPGKPAQA